MTQVQHITNLADWQAVFTGSSPALVFKHSTTCPISARAHRQFHTWAAALPAGHLELAQVRVIEERTVSQEVARSTGVRHASPQVLLLHQGHVLWQATHLDITQEALAAAVASAGL